MNASASLSPDLAERLIVQRESLAEVLPEIVPLLHAHHAEVGHYKDIPLDPDWKRYEATDWAGYLRIYTARLPGAQLIGYAAYFVAPQLHYKGVKRATQDVLYLSPDFRIGGIARRLIGYSEQQLALEGVRVIAQHVTQALDFSPLLDRLGYEQAETIWVKRLDR